MKRFPDGQGHFMVAVPAGSYVPRPVTVTAGQYLR
jgi:hypothetical protein